MTSNNKTRKLSAVMFTDIVGYTALMQKDEARASEIRAKHREVFKKNHNLFNGEIIQYFGDGTLSTFKSAIESVQCAISIQKELRGTLPIPIRIGIHIGDIVFDGTEIYGDGVNLASRIESLGLPGAILISKKVYSELTNHPLIRTRSMGKYSLKNVNSPVSVYAIDEHSIYVPNPVEIKGKLHKKEKSIAVLPFVNFSSDPENEYFADGMTEEIINALTKVKNLNVTSRTSSFYFKNKDIPLKQIGNELNVSTILEGSIRISKKQMRLTAQLIDVEEDFHFWSETFDRSLEDIFAVQDEISLMIADKLREHLGHMEVDEHLVESPDIPVEAYKRYLKARFFIFKMEKSSIEEGLKVLKLIVTEYPNYTDAHLSIHLAYTLLGTIGLIPSAEAFLLGSPSLEKAIRLDKNKPECQLNLAWMTLLQEWNITKTYEHLNKISEAKPIIDFYQSMAATLVAENKTKAAHQYIQTAFQLDPFSHINYHLKGFIYYVNKEYVKAIENFQMALQLNQDFTASILYLGQAYIMIDKYEKANEIFSRVDDDRLKDILGLGGRTLVAAAQNDQENVLGGIGLINNYLESELAERAIYFLILIYTLLKNEEKTLHYIKTGIESRLPMMIYMDVEPMLSNLKSNPEISSSLNGILFIDKPNKNTRKYQKVLLTKNEIIAKENELLLLMANEKPYLNPDLTLRDLAAMIEMPPNYLSQLLNEGVQKNFAEFINTHRVEDFKEKALNPNFKHMSLLGIAYESGFNSKTTFNTYFKRLTGLTPKAFVNTNIQN
jgi:TolB-like protein/AraC-like DNA-binding protein